MDDCIFLLEDRPTQRIAIQNALEMRGFTVQSAGTVREARDISREHGHSFAVAILDMRLEDPEDPHLTGADIGAEISRKQAPRSPEFLIYSAFARLDYYRKALGLGTAAFLQKNKHSVRDLVRHVQALMLRRSLGVKDSEVVDAIKRIIAASSSTTAAITSFCQNLLVRALGKVLQGTPFTLLLSDVSIRDQSMTWPLAGCTLDLPGGPLPLYHSLQELIFHPETYIKPYTVDAAHLGSIKDPDGILQLLDQVAFIPLARTHQIELSLGIGQQTVNQTSAPENVPKLAATIGQYFRNPVFDHLLHITSGWAESDLKNRAELLEAIASFCSKVGREASTIIGEAMRDREIPSRARPAFVKRLQTLSEDLNETGGILQELRAHDSMARASIAAAPLIEETWRHVVAVKGISKDLLSLSGSCHLRVNRDDLFRAFSRILQWQVNRTAESLAVPVGVEPRITISLSQLQASAQIVFEDSSYRVPSVVRKHLFEPFASSTSDGSKGRLGLYLAKALITRNRGCVEDLSDEMEGQEIGHRFVVSFPLPVKPGA